jgi:hypothetical protein
MHSAISDLPAEPAAGPAEDGADEALCLNPTLELWLGLLAAQGTGIPPVSVPLRDAAACLRLAAVVARPGEVDPILSLRAAAPAVADELLAQHPGLTSRTLAVRVACARRGRGRGQTWLGFDEVTRPVVRQLLLWSGADGGELAADEDLGVDVLHDLLELGVVQFAAEASRRVRHCPELGPELRADLAAAAPPADLVVNERVAVRADDLAVAITSPRYGVELEYEIAPALARQIRALGSGSLTPAQLAPDLARALAASELLIGRDAVAAGAVQHAADRAQLAALGYVVLPDLVPPATVAPLRHYVRSLHREGYFMAGDPQIADGLRDIIHNEPVVRELHRRLAAVVSAMAGEELKPSYSVLARYAPGAILRRHVDRAQCAWNVSLAVDESPALEPAQRWPLCFDVAGVVHEARLGPGDAAIYRGTGTPHWRPAQPAGQSSMFVFFHFVASDFTGSLD